MQTCKSRLEGDSGMQQSLLQLAGHIASSEMRAAAAAAAVRIEHSISSHIRLSKTAQTRIAPDWILQSTKELVHQSTCQRERICKLFVLPELDARRALFNGSILPLGSCPASISSGPIVFSGTRTSFLLHVPSVFVGYVCTLGRLPCSLQQRHGGCLNAIVCLEDIFHRLRHPQRIYLAAFRATNSNEFMGGPAERSKKQLSKRSASVH